MGENADFSDNFGTYEHLAITTSHYVLNNYENRNPDTGQGSYRFTLESNTLIPSAIANREFLGDADPENPDITISLNPNINFFLEEDDSLINNDEYDLVTVLLREMVTGCGFSSSLSIEDYMIRNSMKQASNYLYYPVLFDRKLKNEDGVAFSSIAYDENSIYNLYNFFLGKHLFCEGIDGEVFNDDVVGNGISLNTTNRTYNANEDPDNPDLMTWNYRIGKSSVIRKITPITASILNNMGWNIDLADGLSYYNSTIVNVHDTGFIINPGQYYEFRGNMSGLSNYILDSLQLVLVRKDGGHYKYKVGYPILNILFFTYQVSELPAGEEWQRDPDTGHIIGYIRLEGKGKQGYINCAVTGFQRVLLPLKPLGVKVVAKKENVTTASMDAKVTYTSNGATQYVVNYTAYGEAANHSITVNDKEQVAQIIQNLNPAKRYSFYVEGINDAGFSTSETVTIGSNYTTASCVVTKTGTDIKYQVKVGETILEDLVILSAGIYDSGGILKMSLPKIQNQYSDISSLQPGVYVLRLEVKDYGSCGKSFFK